MNQPIAGAADDAQSAAAQSSRASRKRRRRSQRSLRFTRTFFRGFIVLVPLLLTLYLLAISVVFVDASVGAVIRIVLPEEFYYPGMGIASVIALTFFFGLLLQAWFVRRLVRAMEHQLERVPIVKSIYIAISDMVAYFRKTGRDHMSQVVLVTLSPQQQILGLMTRDDLSDLPLGPAKRRVAVYLPMSYQLGGFTVFLPRSAVRPLDMSFEEAMRFILTAGAGGNARLVEEELDAIDHEVALKRHRQERDELVVLCDPPLNPVATPPNAAAGPPGDSPRDPKPT